MSVSQNLQTYAEQANHLVKNYNRLSTPDHIPQFADFVLDIQNRENTNALDLGCGSGRDAKWMAEQGLRVTAVDGCPAMLEQAKNTNHHDNITYSLAIGPAFNSLLAKNTRYDIILCSALIFHFSPDEQNIFFQSLKKLAAPTARCYITLRHGPTPDGRVFFKTGVEDIEDHAQKIGATITPLGRSKDTAKRADVMWDHLFLDF